MNLAEPSLWPHWNSLQQCAPPLFQDVLVYRSAIAHRGPEVIPEDRGVNRYDIDRYTGLDEYPWLHQGGCLYFRFAVLPPPNHPAWIDPTEKSIPNQFPYIAVVLLKRAGHYAGTFLAKSTQFGSEQRPHIYVPKQGFVLLNNEHILRWLIAPDVPDLTEREQRLEQAMLRQN